MHQPPAPKRPQDHKLKVIPRELAKKPAWVPPHVVSTFIAFPDLPGFGFDLLTVNGVEVYRACNFIQTPNGGQARVIPIGGVAMFFSREEAEAFKEQVKQDSQKTRLIVPGDPRFAKPR